MRYRLSPSPQPRRARSAFTLLELLMVVSIIAILVSLLIPAVTSVMKKGKIAQVKAEITALDNACADFNNSHQHYPPSYIILYEQASAPWDADSRSKIKSIWPEFDFSVGHDFNGDGTIGGTHTLEGDECLVFFLGGIPNLSGGKFSLTGFSANKANPIAPGGKSRKTFFKDWDVGRLTDRDSDGFPEYTDVMNAGKSTATIRYLSTNNPSAAYRISDINFSGNTMTSVYMQGNAPWNPGGFQIISPGADGQFGTGGNYIKDDAASMSGRPLELDNITNFSSGILEN